MKTCRVAFPLLVLLGFLATWNTGCGDQGDKQDAGSEPAGLQITETIVGEGTLATEGDFVVAHVVCWYSVNGRPDEVFQTTYDLEYPPMFQLGKSMVFAGLEQGITGMREGGKRHLVIPPDLAFGQNGKDPVPPNSTVIVDVELLKVPLVDREVIEAGEGESINKGDTIKLHYDGWLTENGERAERFDSSLVRGAPIIMAVGAGKMIPGFEMGIVNMRVGGKTLVTIPPELGYGHRGLVNDGQVVVPPGSTLEYEIHLLEIMN